MSIWMIWCKVRIRQSWESSYKGFLVSLVIGYFIDLGCIWIPCWLIKILALNWPSRFLRALRWWAACLDLEEWLCGLHCGCSKVLEGFDSIPDTWGHQIKWILEKWAFGVEIFWSQEFLLLSSLYSNANEVFQKRNCAGCILMISWDVLAISTVHFH